MRPLSESTVDVVPGFTVVKQLTDGVWYTFYDRPTSSVKTYDVGRSVTPPYQRRYGFLPLSYSVRRSETHVLPGETVLEQKRIETYDDPNTGLLKVGRTYYETTYHAQGTGIGLSVVEMDNHVSEIIQMHDKTRERCINALIEEVGSSTVNLAQALAESKQTAKMLSSFVNHLAMSFRDLRKGRLKDAAAWWGFSPSKRSIQRFNKVYVSNPRDADRVMSSGWLALQYGIKPFLEDLDGSMKTLAQIDRSPLIGHVVTHRSDRVSFTDTLQTPWGLKATNMINEYFSCTRGLTFVVDHDPVRALAQTGFTSPLLLAWELIPYSFVVDQFLQVGNYLKGQSAFDGLAVTHGFISEKTDSRTFLQTSYYAVDDNSISRSNGGSSYKLKNFSRSLDSTTPVPIFPSFKVPSFNGLVSDLALLHQATSKRLK